ncbi:MAG: hypothetical protein ACE15C_21045 [Phycisphaerae bacterium]
MLANREGLFNAYPVEIGLSESRQNKLLQVVILYRLVEEQVEGQWSDCSEEHLEITGYHILEKRDHSLNEKTIGALKDALGWDGRDPFWLQDNAAELAQKPVQVKLAFEEYDGQQTLKVQYLNPYGSQRGGVAKADDEMRRSVGNRLGSKFRALAGGTPVNPPKPAGKPTAPAPPAKPVAAAPAAASSPAAAPSQPAQTAPAPSAPPQAQPAPTATMEQAWEEFNRHCPPPPEGKWDQASVEKEWFRIIAALFPGKQPDQLTPADWAVMVKEAPGRIIPF